MSEVGPELVFRMCFSSLVKEYVQLLHPNVQSIRSSELDSLSKSLLRVPEVRFKLESLSLESLAGKECESVLISDSSFVSN